MLKQIAALAAFTSSLLCGAIRRESLQSHFAIDFAFRERDGPFWPFVSRIYKRTRRTDSGTALA
jgi:hypothetical protein